MWATLGR